MRRFSGRKAGRALFILLAAVLICLCPMDTRAESRIFIDANHKYEGMEHTFARGYVPSIEKNTMTLVVPFMADGKMEKNQITVGIDFVREENSPFYYKSYQKQVEQGEKGVYLYQCRLKLKADRINGQYPLHLWAEGKVQEGTLMHQEFTIYVEITDGKALIQGTGEETEDGEDSGEGNIPPVENPDEVSEGQMIEMAEQAGTEQLESSMEEKSSQPRLLVSQNSFQGTELEAGSSALWELSVQNCSKNQTVENVKITLLSDSQELAFEKTSWYFEKTAPRETMELNQNLTVAKKAAPETHQIQLQVEYEDEKGNSYTTTETITLSICQPQQAELVNLSFPEKVYASDTQEMTFQVLNTGLSTLYNVRVRLEGRGLFPKGELFLGNLEGGTSTDGMLQVFAGTLDMDEQGNLLEGSMEKYGDTTGTVIFSYEDEQGEIKEQRTELCIFIQEPEKVELKIEAEKPKTNQWWLTIGAGIFLALILVIVWLYLRIRHYQQMQEKEQA